MDARARTGAGHQDEDAAAAVEADVAVLGENGGEAAPGREREALVGGEVLGLEADVGSEGAGGAAQQGDGALAHLEEIPLCAAAGGGADGAPVVEEGGDAAAGRAVPRPRGQVEQQVEDAAVGALATGEVADLAFDVVGAPHLGRRRAVGGGGGKERAQDGARRIRGPPPHGRSRSGRGAGPGKGPSSAGTSGIGSEARWQSGIASALTVAS